ncbi:unnamed protein product [Didymodactylos carnosus]|uniref:Uncharacterized protein n=1 Tax=Didymodactylos carnosus TaxID=1234261 RepID=A0A814LIU0_9BILA|nr:unnamed protein product [Didymodactylos carnosus]CAF3831902.1 unnamed protein product [Didymodactylos carnosus]
MDRYSVMVSIEDPQGNTQSSVIVKLGPENSCQQLVDQIWDLAERQSSGESKNNDQGRWTFTAVSENNEISRSTAASDSPKIRN